MATAATAGSKVSGLLASKKYPYDVASCLTTGPEGDVAKPGRAPVRSPSSLVLSGSTSPHFRGAPPAWLCLVNNKGTMFRALQ